ncbi:MAG: diguanylate cyclase [Nitrospiraceae bacterium]|nr:diguanylate cyclase [Nitrospiraceae bacterium]
MKKNPEQDETPSSPAGEALLALLEELAVQDSCRSMVDLALSALGRALGAEGVLLVTIDGPRILRAAIGPEPLLSRLLSPELPPDPSHLPLVISRALEDFDGQSRRLILLSGLSAASHTQPDTFLFLVISQGLPVSPLLNTLPPSLVSRIGALLKHGREESHFFDTLLELKRLIQQTEESQEEGLPEAIASLLARSFAIPLVLIGRRFPGEQKIEILAKGGEKDPAGGNIQNFDLDGEGVFLAEHTLNSGSMEVVPDLSALVETDTATERNRRIDLGSGLIQSATMKDGAQIVIFLSRAEQGSFPGEFLSFIKEVASDLASFFDRVRLERERKSLSSYQEAIRRVQQAFIEARDRESMYRSLVETIVRYAGAIGSYVAVQGPEGSVEIRAVETVLPEMTEATRALRFSNEGEEAVGPSLSALAFRERRIKGPVRSEDWPFLQEMARRFPVLSHIGSAMAFPVMTERDLGPAAVFVVWSRDPGHFTESLRSLLATLADSLGRAIWRLEQEETIRRLSRVTQETDDAICILEGDSRVTWANAAFSRQTGIPAENLCGMDLASLFATAGLPSGTPETILSRVRSGQSFEESISFLSVDGRSSWLLMKGFPLPGGGNLSKEYGLVSSDITKIREAAIRQEISGLFQETLSVTLKSFQEASPSLEILLGRLADRVFAVLKPRVLLLIQIPAGKNEPDFILIRGEDQDFFTGLPVLGDPLALFEAGQAAELLEREGSRAFLFARENLSDPLALRAKAMGISGALLASVFRKGGKRIFVGACFSDPLFADEVWAEPFMRVAQEIALALDKRKLEEELRTLTAYQEAVMASQQAFLAAKTRDDLYGISVRTISRVTDTLAVYVLERTPETDELVMTAHASRDERLVAAMKELRFPLEGEEGRLTIAARAWREKRGKIERISDGLVALRSYREIHPELGVVREILAVPVLLPSQEEPVAVLALSGGREGEFSEDHLRLGEHLSQSLALAIDRLTRETELERLSLVAQKTTDGILMTDPAGHILWVNRAFEERFGYRLSEVRGHFAADFRSGEATDLATLGRIRDHVAAHRAFQETMIHYSRSGEPVWLRVNATALFSPEGQPMGYVSVETDVTALKESEERARIASLFYRALSESVQILRERDESPEEEVLRELLERLREILNARFTMVGRLPPGATLLTETLAAVSQDLSRQGAEEATIPGGQISTEGPGMAAMALRTGRPQILLSEEPDYPGMRPNPGDRKYGKLSVSAARVGGEKLLLQAQFSEDTFLGQESATLFQRIVVEIAAFLDRKERVRRERRRAHYRVVAERVLSDLFLVKTESDVYRILAETLSGEKGVLFVDLLVPGKDHFERKIIQGELSSLIFALPLPPLYSPSEGEIPLPTRVYSSGTACSIHYPARDLSLPEAFRTTLLREAGIVAGWPIKRPEGEIMAVMAMGARDPAPFSDQVLLDLMKDLSERAAFAIERMRLLEKMEDLSVHDPLTGLLNRRGLGLFMGQFLASVERRKTLALVGILDLDDFKPVNDTFGHSAGDNLLVEIAGRLRRMLRDSDLAGRLGGDEFVVVAEISDMAHFHVFMDRISVSLSSPYMIPESPSDGLAVGVSMGAVLFPEEKGDPDLLLRHADLALYDIKRLKGQRNVWWKLWEKS